MSADPDAAAAAAYLRTKGILICPCADGSGRWRVGDTPRLDDGQVLRMAEKLRVEARSYGGPRPAEPATSARPREP